MATSDIKIDQKNPIASTEAITELVKKINEQFKQDECTFVTLAEFWDLVNKKSLEPGHIYCINKMACITALADNYWVPYGFAFASGKPVYWNITQNSITQVNSAVFGSEITKTEVQEAIDGKKRLV